MKIGDMLVKEGLITREQLIDALIVQKKSPEKKIGAILLELEFLNVDDFEKILEFQMKEMGLAK